MPSRASARFSGTLGRLCQCLFFVPAAHSLAHSIQLAVGGGSQGCHLGHLYGHASPDVITSGVSCPFLGCPPNPPARDTKELMLPELCDRKRTRGNSGLIGTGGFYTVSACEALEKQYFFSLYGYKCIGDSFSNSKTMLG